MNDLAGCPNFNTCSANLCPLDPELEKRTWAIGEDICPARNRARMPMIQRQKQLNRRRSKRYLGSVLSPAWLRKTAHRKRELSEEEKAVLLDRLRKKGKAI